MSCMKRGYLCLLIVDAFLSPGREVEDLDMTASPHRTRSIFYINFSYSQKQNNFIVHVLCSTFNGVSV